MKVIVKDPDNYIVEIPTYNYTHQGDAVNKFDKIDFYYTKGIGFKSSDTFDIGYNLFDMYSKSLPKKEKELIAICKKIYNIFCSYHTQSKKHAPATHFSLFFPNVIDLQYSQTKQLTQQSFYQIPLEEAQEYKSRIESFNKTVLSLIKVNSALKELKSKEKEMDFDFLIDYQGKSINFSYLCSYLDGLLPKPKQLSQLKLWSDFFKSMDSSSLVHYESNPDYGLKHNFNLPYLKNKGVCFIELDYDIDDKELYTYSRSNESTQDYSKAKAILKNPVWSNYEEDDDYTFFARYESGFLKEILGVGQVRTKSVKSINLATKFNSYIEKTYLEKTIKPLKIKSETAVKVHKI